MGAPALILDRFRLDGHVVIITGASRGLGAACALSLAEAGADLVLASRLESDLNAVADQINKTGQRTEVVPIDLSDPEAATTLVHAAQKHFGRLDVVVNNVGGGAPRPILQTAPEYLEELFHFNVSTAHALTRAAAPVMIDDRGGAIVNMSSTVGHAVERGLLAYGTAKAALTHYTKLAAADLAPRVRVNAVAPGVVATSEVEQMLGNGEMRQRSEQATHLRRLADPSEIAAAVLYLASAASSYITGKVLAVDGGAQLPNLHLGLADL